jgi:dolichyl-phosphate beta-glucosyltransferase
VTPTDDAPELSLVIPAYNEAQRLPPTLRHVRAYLDARGRSYEIVVADDGSRDGTAEVARAAGGDVLRVVASPVNRGKGHAVRQGMLAARGRLRLMCDADLSTSIEQLERLEALVPRGYDVVIGSRAITGAQVEVRQTGFRENAGRLFNLLVRLVALPEVRDTQCGFKLFTGEAAEGVFAVARLDGFAFDVEALFLARHQGRRLAEVPVVWRNDPASRVSFGKGARAFFEILGVRWHALRGRYRPRA